MRFKRSFLESPRQAFEIVQVLHLMFISAVGLYVIVGETLRFSDDNFGSKGLADLGKTIWIVRGLLIAYSAFVMALVQTVYNDAMIVKIIGKAKEVSDRTVTKALYSVQLTRVTFGASVGVYGLVLYLLNANRLDLYGFGLASLSGLLLFRPKRELWETTFRDMSVKYPAVSSSPWAPYP